MEPRTLGELAGTHGFAVLEHLEAETEIPVVDGLQAQGDLILRPMPGLVPARGDELAVPQYGVAVIDAVGGGHEHRLFAEIPGTAWWTPASRSGQVIGTLTCDEPAVVLHPEHGATRVAPGTWELRRQREKADEERLVAD